MPARYMNIYTASDVCDSYLSVTVMLWMLSPVTMFNTEQTYMQLAIDLAYWLLIVVWILPTGNIFLKY